MSAKRFFLDTNVIAYTFDKSAPEKQITARQLLELSLAGKGFISYQVMQEFINISVRKFSPAMTAEQAQRYLQDVLMPICKFYPNEEFYRRGLGIHERWRFGWYDSLIITAALEMGCDVLYSEDLQHKQTIETLTVINPFIK